MKTIAAITVGRSDYGIYLPVFRKLAQSASLKLEIIAAGMHLSPEFGKSVHLIEEDGFNIAGRVEMLLSSDSPEGISQSMGLGTIGFAQTYERLKPDVILALGDRFEMIAGVLAAVPFNIPIAHIHGGEVTTGAIDDKFRHAITKLSDIHFASTQEYADRILRMEADPQQVFVSGAPSLDNLREIQLLDKDAIEQKLGISLETPFLLITFHSITTDFENTETYIEQLLQSLEKTQMPCVFTMANADTGGRIINQKLQDFVNKHPNASLFDNLGTMLYFSLMAQAAAMVGNSSSGIIEATSFSLPVVNIGTRQDGRTRGPNVIDTAYDSSAIQAAIAQATSDDFRINIQGKANPYGDGHAADIIVKALEAYSS